MPLSANAALRKDRTTTTELQHRHFAFIANALLHARTAPNVSYPGWCETVTVFANLCSKSNPRFDRKRFLTACGYYGDLDSETAAKLIA